MNQNLYNQLTERQKALQKELAAIDVLLKIYKGNNGVENQDAAEEPKRVFTIVTPEFPDAYAHDLTLIQKIYVAIKHIKRGDTDAIAQQLRVFDSSLTEKKAKGDATYYASKLYKAGKIGAERKGYKYIYFCK